MDPLKILLVDDSKTARYKLRLALQEHGVEVQVAESAEEALSQIKRLDPDAILMDHTMPGMNGFEALEILKADPETAQIPVIMCSAHEDETFMARAKRLGALGILPKANPAETAEKLPGTLDLIRQTLASAFVSAAPAAVARAAPERPAAAPPLPVRPRPIAAAPSSSAPLGQVEALVARQLGRIEQQLRAEIEARCDALEQSLATSERILIHRIEQAAAPAEKKGVADQIAAEVARVAAKELPALAAQRLEQERDQILALLQQRAGQALLAPAIDQAVQRLRASLYAFSALAAGIGIGAALLVYTLLGGWTMTP